MTHTRQRAPRAVKPIPHNDKPNHRPWVPWPPLVSPHCSGCSCAEESAQHVPRECRAFGPGKVREAVWGDPLAEEQWQWRCNSTTRSLPTSGQGMDRQCYLPPQRDSDIARDACEYDTTSRPRGAPLDLGPAMSAPLFLCLPCLGRI